MNGVRSHHDEIQLLLKDHDIHILANNKTKLDPATPHSSPELMGLSMSVRIGRSMEETLLSMLRIPLVTSYEMILLIMTSIDLCRNFATKAKPYLFVAW